MKIKGHFDEKGELQVFVNGERLDPKPSQEVWNHSPDGFGVGYGGSGPAQLALAILLASLPKEQAVSLHQDFKWDVIAKLPQSDFEIDLDLGDWLWKRGLARPPEDPFKETRRKFYLLGNESGIRVLRVMGFQLAEGLKVPQETKRRILILLIQQGKAQELETLIDQEAQKKADLKQSQGA
jgi:hypothetical protein